MGLPILAEIERLIVERGSAAVLRERLALANDRFIQLEAQVAKLEKENGELREQLQQLQQQRPGPAPREQFAEARGALFKRTAGGAYADVPYCPSCHLSTSPWPPRTGEYACSRCNWMADFTPRDLPAVMATLPK
jgi:hypothetical protein